MKKKRWAYVFNCPICRERVRVLADLGVTPEKPEVPFDSRCPNCHATIQFKPAQLTEVEV